MTDPLPPEAHTLRDLARARFSCRAYRPDPVPEAVIRQIADIARHTASWCNVQPWQVVIVSGAALETFRAALMRRAETDEAQPDYPFPPGYEGVYKERRRASGYQLYAALGIARDDHPRRRRQAHENFRLFGAPHVAIIATEAAIGPYALVDCGAFIGNFLLAARALGVDTTPQAALAQHSGFIRAHLGLPDSQRVICGISFGYADRDHPANGYRTPRAEPDDFLRLL